MIRATRILLLVSLTLTACKKDGDDPNNEIASIDVIMQESLKKDRNNKCGIDLRHGKLTAAAKKRLVRTNDMRVFGPVDEDDVRGMLAAVPETLHKQFFDRFNGVLEVRVDAQATCIQKWKEKAKTDKLTAEQENRLKDLQGCWLVEHDEKGAPKSAWIFVTSDYRVLHNTILPLFSFFFSEYVIDTWLPDYRETEGASADFVAAADAFIDARDELAKGMWKDIERTKNDNLLAMYRRFFGFEGSIDGAPVEVRKAFGSYVFAEAMDSRHCSTGTLKTFKTEAYAGAYKAFAAMDEVFGKAWFE